MKQAIFLAALPLTLALAVATVATSCARDNQTRENISLVHYFTGSLSAGINEMANEFNASSLTTELLAAPLEHEAFKTTIRIQLEGPNPPELFSYWAGAKTKNLINRGVIRPLDDVFDSLMPAGLFARSTIKAMTYDGKIYMLPLSKHYVGFFYNTKLFAELGISTPKTWDDLLSTVQTLRRASITPISLGAQARWPAQFYFDYLLLGTAGFEWRERLMKGLESWTDPKVAKAFSLWTDLIHAGAFNSTPQSYGWDTAALDVVHGKAGMTLMGTWLIGLYQESGYEGNIDYSFFPFPVIQPDIAATALGPIDGILASNAKPHTDGSDQVLLNLANAKLQQSFNTAAGSIAPNTLVPRSVYSPLQQQIAQLMDEAENWAFNFDLACPPLVSEKGLNTFVEFLTNPDSLARNLRELNTLAQSGKD